MVKKLYLKSFFWKKVVVKRGCSKKKVFFWKKFSGKAIYCGEKAVVEKRCGGEKSYGKTILVTKSLLW